VTSVRAVLDPVAAVRAADTAHALFPRGASVVVAVSGGADSMALLEALSAYAPERGLKLVAAHLDHGLHGASRVMAAVVERAAAERGLRFVTARRDVGAIAAREGRGIEDSARRVRYAWLAECAAQVGAPVVAVAHQADDQVETVLMNLVRGAGLDGLTGMSPIAPWPLDRASVLGQLEVGGDSDRAPTQARKPATAGQRLENGAPLLPLVVRPLLSIEAEALRAWLRARGVAWLEDPTNAEADRFRNAIRLRVLPVLRELNPRLAAAVGRTSETLAADAACLADLAADALDRAGEAASPRAQAIAARRGAPAVGALDVAVLRSLHVALARRVIRSALAREGIDLREAGWLHVETVRACLDEGGPAASSLPGGWRAVVADGLLSLEAPADEGPARERGCGRRSGVGPVDQASTMPTALAVPGETALPGGWQVVCERRPRRGGDETPPADAWTARIDASAAPEGLAARWRRPGDRFRPTGMGGHSKSLQDFFVDQRVPAAERDLWPLIVAAPDGPLLWVAGLRVDRQAAVRSSTELVIELRARPPGWRGPNRRA